MEEWFLLNCYSKIVVLAIKTGLPRGVLGIITFYENLSSIVLRLMTLDCDYTLYD